MVRTVFVCFHVLDGRLSLVLLAIGTYYANSRPQICQRSQQSLQRPCTTQFNRGQIEQLRPSRLRFRPGSRLELAILDHFKRRNKRCKLRKNSSNKMKHNADSLSEKLLRFMISFKRQKIDFLRVK